MKVLLVDDHALIRDALRGVLADLVEGARILEASDCRHALRLVEENADLELILLDLNLPDRNGFEVLADLRRRYPTISVVVLSASMTGRTCSGRSISERSASSQNRKRGRSGNPRGRPKGSRNLASDLAAELGEQITVREDGCPRRISKQRALIKSLMARALRGDVRATAAMLCSSRTAIFSG